MTDDEKQLTNSELDDILLNDPNNPVKIVPREDGLGHKFQYPFTSMADMWKQVAEVCVISEGS